MNGSPQQQISDDTMTPAAPDIRQSICHTVLAAGFTLINVQNPSEVDVMDSPQLLIILIAMPALTIFSWYLFYLRLQVWKKIPQTTREMITRSPQDLKTRAYSHLMMALLASGLTTIGYIGHLIVPLSQYYGETVSNIILILDGTVGIVSIAVISRTVRNLFEIFRAS